MLSFISFLLTFTLTLRTTGLHVNITRLHAHLTTLATHNDLIPPAVQRILYTPSDISARLYLKSLFRSAGLTTHEDPLGNIFATWSGTDKGILTGSHFDAIPNSGMYDGTLGILSALEAVTALKETGFVPRRSITILAFTSEEPTRFGLSCIGSRILSGALDPSELANLTDNDGVPFHKAREAAGYGGDVKAVPLGDEYTAFVELHSEQGPYLETSGIQIGAVTAIAAPAALTVTFTGPGGHAGTTLMHTRKDPSLAAAELSLSVEAAVGIYGGNDTVGTTGKIDVVPNAINSVPTMASVGVDVRDSDRERRDQVLTVIESAIKVIAEKRSVGVEVAVNSRDPPAVCNDTIVETVVDVAKEQGLEVVKMVSRAYHDALFMAGRMPTAMIFVPCRAGVSHRPDEFVADQDIENGVKVLAGVLRRLAGDGSDAEKVRDGIVEGKDDIKRGIDESDRARGEEPGDAEVDTSEGEEIEKTEENDDTIVEGQGEEAENFGIGDEERNNLSKSEAAESPEAIESPSPEDKVSDAEEVESGIYDTAVPEADASTKTNTEKTLEPRAEEDTEPGTQERSEADGVSASDADRVANSGEDNNTKSGADEIEQSDDEDSSQGPDITAESVEWKLEAFDTAKGNPEAEKDEV